jgi:hypothetical protein
LANEQTNHRDQKKLLTDPPRKREDIQIEFHKKKRDECQIKIIHVVSLTGRKGLAVRKVWHKTNLCGGLFHLRYGHGFGRFRSLACNLLIKVNLPNILSQELSLASSFFSFNECQKSLVRTPHRTQKLLKYS